MEILQFKERKNKILGYRGAPAPKKLYLYFHTILEVLIAKFCFQLLQMINVKHFRLKLDKLFCFETISNIDDFFLHFRVEKK